MEKNYYELLEVTPSASEEELRRAYRRLAREHHPDANGGDPKAEARFKELTVAYETLRDPERRRRYDMFGPNGGRAGSTPTGDFFGGGLGDIFESLFNSNPFGGGSTNARQAGQRRGDDIEATVEVSFEESIFGVDMPVAVRAPTSCAACGASGASPGTLPVRCKECGGIGQVRRVRQSILGQVVSTSPCPSCRGFGTVIESPCAACRGDGRITETREVTVEVPPGVDSGTTLRVTSVGGAALRGGINGDLYVHLRVQNDDRFTRNGANLETTLHVPMTVATLGGRVEVATLDGPELVSVAPGTQTGKIVRIKNRGIPHMRGGGRGDLQVLIFVDTPSDLTKEQSTLLRELASQRSEEVSPEESGLMSRIRSSFG